MSNGSILTEGKTKRISETSDPEIVLVQSKDDITAGDGAKRDVIVGKAALATRTTVNVFKLLRDCGVPVSFLEQVDKTSFLAKRCGMIPLEVVARRQAWGSALKRNPALFKGQLFSPIQLELFLKTSGKKWNGVEIPTDDPLAVVSACGQHMKLFLPDRPLIGQEPFLVLDDFPLKNQTKILEEILYVTKWVFLILEKAWQLAKGTLIDFKLEFGFDSDGKLILSDVVDNDSWRVLQDSQHLDKEIYRQGEKDLNEITRKYKIVADITDGFVLPRQRIIFWRASQMDDLSPFKKALLLYTGFSNPYETIEKTFSLHKQPEKSLTELRHLINEVPDTVLIVFCGRSNGAGPTLSANCSVPVITVPASWKEFPEDIWSSLRTPSNTPVSTILEPSNAVLHALQILALRNPALYAKLTMKQEDLN